MTTLRTVFMGTPEIAVPALTALAGATTVTCVVTQPDRPAGRGNHLHASPIKRAALALGLPVWQPDSLRAAADDPRLTCDLAVVMAYGELLRQDVLDRPRHGCINLHASLLPRWRGASPLQAALRAGDPVSGVTVMRMVRALDAGPIYLSRALDLTAGMTLPQLHDAMALLAAAALGDLLGRWPLPEPQPQDDAQATLCRKLASEDGHLDFHRTACELERWVRAYTPAPGCWAWAHGAHGLPPQRLRLLQVAPVAPEIATGPVGQLSRVGDQLLVATGSGMLSILILQVPGGRALAARDYLHGHALPERLD